MGQRFNIEGVGLLEFPDDASLEEIQQYLDENYSAPKTSALGAFGRGAGTSLLPTAAGMAAAAPLMPWAAATAAPSFGASFLVPLLVGGVASWVASKAQKPVLDKMFPELEELQRADIEQHPIAGPAGRLAPILTMAEFSPGQTIRGLASIPTALSKTAAPEVVAAARQAAMAPAVNVGLQEAMLTGSTLATEGRFPTIPEHAEAVTAGAAFGKMRYGLGQPKAKPKIAPITDESPEAAMDRAMREGKVVTKIKSFGYRPEVLETTIPGYDDTRVAQAMDDGSVQISRPALQKYFEEYIKHGTDLDMAVDAVVTEEVIHSIVRGLKEGGVSIGDAKAKQFWIDFTSLEKKMMTRLLKGKRPGAADPAAQREYDRVAANDQDMGHEAVRFLVQRAGGMTPGEFIELTSQPGEAFTSKMLAQTVDFVRWTRRNIAHTDASGRQVEFLNRVESNLNAAIKAAQAREGETDASEVTSTEGVGVRSEGGEVGAETPLRQSGQAAEAQAAKAVEGKKEVLLEKAAEPTTAEPALPALNKDNPYAESLNRNRLNVQVLEKASAKDNRLLPELEAARRDLAEAQRWYEAAEKTIAAEKAAGPKPQKEVPKKEKPVTLVSKLKGGTPDEGLWFGPQKPLPNEVVVEAAYVDDAGNIHYGSHHPEALRKAGGEELVNKFPTRESRNTPRFGYRTNKRPFVSRKLGGEIAKGFDQDLRVHEGPIHSDEIASVVQPGKTVAEQVSPSAQPGGTPSTAPAKGAATAAGAVTPAAEPAISKATPTVEQAQGAAQKAYQEWARELARRTLAREKTTADDRSKLFKLHEAAKAERARMAGAPGMTMKPGRGQEPVPEVVEFANLMKRGGANINNTDTKRVGLQVKSVSDLDILLEANRHVRSKFSEAANSKNLNEMQKWPTQFPRETIETAVNFGSTNEKMQSGLGRPMGERPLDWHNNPEVARWMVEHADELRWTNVEELREVKASLGPGMTMKAAPKGPPPTKDEIITAIKSMAPKGGSLDEGFVQKAGAFVASQDPGRQPEALAFVRQKIEEAVLKAADEKIPPQDTVTVGGRQLQLVSIPVGREAAIKASVFHWLNNDQKPVQMAPLPQGRTMETVKEGKKYIRLTTKHEVTDPTKIRFNLNTFEGMAKILMEPDFNVEGFSLEYLRHLWNESLPEFFNGVPKAKLEEYRRAHQLEGGKFRGELAEPDTDKLFLETQNIKPGEAPPGHALYRAALANGIDVTDPGWEKKIINILRSRWEQGIREMGAAIGPDPWVYQKLTPEQMAAAGAKPGTKEAFRRVQVKRTPKEMEKLEAQYYSELKRKQDRRYKLIAELIRRLTKSAQVTSRSVLRPTIHFDDIWFSNTNGDVGPFTRLPVTMSTEDLARALVDESAGTSQKTHRIAVLVNRHTGDTEAVSVYPKYISRGVSRAMVYDPRGVPGEKKLDHVQFDELLNDYEYKYSFMVESPVTNFHQHWNSELDFLMEIGNRALERAHGSSNWQRFVRETARRREEILRERQEQNRQLTTKELTELQELEAQEAERIRAGGEERELTPDELAKSQEPGYVEKTGSRLGRLEEKRRQLEHLQDLYAAQDVETIESKIKSALPFGMESISDIEKIPDPLGKAMAESERGLIGLERRGHARDSVTHVEAKALGNLFNMYSPSRKPPKRMVISPRVKAPTRVQIRSMDDIEEALKAIQQMARQENPLTKAPRGLLGRDLSLMSAIDKIAWKYRSEKMENPGRNEDIAQFGLEKNLKGNRLYEEYYQAVDEEALSMAMVKIYEIAEASTRSPAEVKAGKFPIDSELFAVKLLAEFGENAGRDVKSSAVSQGADPNAFVPTGKQLVDRVRARLQAADLQAYGLARELGASGGRGPVPGVKKIVPERGVPPRAAIESALGPESAAFVGREAEKMYGPGSPHWATLPYPLGPGKYGGPRFTGAAPKGEPKYMEFEAPVRKRYAPWEARAKVAEATRKRREAIRKEMGGAAPGMSMKRGVSRRVLEERAAAMGGREYEPNKMRTNQDIASEGELLYATGKIDPLEAMNKVEISGESSPQEQYVCQYFAKVLQADADVAYENFGPKSDAFRNAQRTSEIWNARFTSGFGSAAGERLRAMQGYSDADLGSYEGVKRKLREIKNRDLTEEETSETDDYVEGVRNEREATELKVQKLMETMDKVDEPVLSQEQKSFADRLDVELGLAGETLDAEWQARHPKGAPMAMKGAEGLKLTPADLELLQKRGGLEMINLSRQGKLSDSYWRETMLQKYEGIGPHLDEIQAGAERFRNNFLAQKLGADAAMAPIRKKLSRKLPSIEDSKLAVQRANAWDPVGKRISAAEAYHMWNFVKQKYLRLTPEQGRVTDPDEVMTRAAIDLGISRERVHRGLSSNKAFRQISKEMYEQMQRERHVLSQAKNWLKNQEYPGWLRFIRSVPRWFFVDKVIGHGTVGMITHASNMAFNPMAWKTYFPAWRDMYVMVFDSAAHMRMMKGIETHPNYKMWTQARLQINPFKYTDDYHIASIHKFFQTVGGKKGTGIWKGMVSGRGFDALKTLRLARAEQMWDAVPLKLRTPAMAAEIARSVNYATGIVTASFHESANWLMFAPKLEFSRWGFMFGDPIRAAGIFARWSKSTPEQRYWAISEAKQKALMVATYYSLLAMNQGFLKAIGSDQDVNLTDVRKGDFMAFKVAGFNVGLAGPLIGMVRLLGDMLHIGQGEQTPLERLDTRGEALGGRIARYARGKFSPFASFAYDISTQQDFRGRPLPWSSDRVPRYRRLQGIDQYDWSEYLLATASPIPVEEAIREVFSGAGMDDMTASKLIHSLTIVGGMAATGARITSDVEVAE